MMPGADYSPTRRTADHRADSLARLKHLTRNLRAKSAEIMLGRARQGEGDANGTARGRIVQFLEKKGMPMHIRSSDDPFLPKITIREVLLGWGLLSLAVIALFAFGAFSPCTHAGTHVTALTSELEPHRSATILDDLDSETDRVGMLAGLEADNEIPNRNSTGRIEPMPSSCNSVRAAPVSG
jgi:hypothetical protein